MTFVTYRPLLAIVKEGIYFRYRKQTVTMSAHKNCPVTVALDLISRKWSIPIFMLLMHAEAPVRFGQLQKSIGGVSQRELTKHLREFEASGLVSRKIYAQVPPRVDYQLTELGRSLFGPITALNDWATTYGAEIQKSRLSQAA